jgi:FkbM family methyltransferase
MTRNKRVRFSFDRVQNVFVASEAGLVRHFSSKRRGFWLYRQGIRNRGRFLYDSYCLGNIRFGKTDVVIDCGANYGDLYIALADKILPQNYVAIEPSPTDFLDLQRNTPNAILVNKALGSASGKRDLYVQTADGNSSLIEPPQYTEIVTVDVWRLDELKDELRIGRIKLLKIEAEGFEPEVLEGAVDTLSECEYVAINGAYERGKAQDQTFTNVSNFLIGRGFLMKDIYFPWYRALFQNPGLPS